jgi:hypothetical protein
MATQSSRDVWRAIWQVTTSDGVLVVLLLSIAAGLIITSWLPQVPSTDPAAYARWLSGTQAQFGKATPTMQTLGLFTITRSFSFRALLSLLAGCLLLRLIENSDHLWQSKGTTEIWTDLFPLLAHAGVLLLLLGLLLTHQWGWRVDGLILQSGERITLPDNEKWVALSDDIRKVTHSPGVVTFIEEHGPGVQVNATDGAGHSLPLQTVGAAPVTQLTVALTEERYFAIPEARLGVRLASQLAHTTQAHNSVLVQVYHSPPWRLVTETVVEEEAQVTVDDVTLMLTNIPYTQLTAAFNPGRWPTGIGLVFLVIGLLGNVAWPERRFRLREEEEA